MPATRRNISIFPRDVSSRSVRRSSSKEKGPGTPGLLLSGFAGRHGLIVTFDPLGLDRPLLIIPAELAVGMKRPVRIVDSPPRQGNEICFTVFEDGFGLFNIAQKANGHGGNVGALAHRLGKRHLIGRGRLDTTPGEAAARAIDGVDAERLQLPRESNAVLDLPAIG